MNPHLDAFVLFGATRDLAYNKIFPALQAMIRRGRNDIPSIGYPGAWRHLKLTGSYREMVTGTTPALKR